MKVSVIDIGRRPPRKEHLSDGLTSKVDRFSSLNLTPRTGNQNLYHVNDTTQKEAQRS